MATRTSDEVQILCYPEEATPYRNRAGTVIADVLGGQMTMGGGDTGGLAFQSANPTISVPWLNGSQTAFTSQSGVDFVRFFKDGTFIEGASIDDGQKSEIAGFILEGRIAPLDCKMAGESVTDGGNFDLSWRKITGTWKGVLPPDTPRRNRIKNTGSSVTAMARTKGNIPANRSMQFDIVFESKDPTGPTPRFRVAWGSLYSIVLMQGAKPTVERIVNGAWSVWRKLDQCEPVKTNGGRYVVKVRRIAGRLVVSINDKSFHFVETKKIASRLQPVPKTVTWQTAPLLIAANNVRVQFGVSLIKYATPEDAVFTGTFSRRFPRESAVSEDDLAAAAVSGWSPAGGSATASATIEPHLISYSCTLSANAQGLDTPFVNKVLVRSAGRWTSGPTSPLDIAPACDTMTVAQAMPPIMPGAEAVINVDRVLLGQIDPDWEAFATRYHLIDIRTRTKYDDGSYSDWTNLFGGYIYRVSKGTSGVNEQTMVLTCRDPILRLQAPAAPIDHRYPPLDFLFASNLLGETTGALYGGECVKEILDIALGPDVSAALNGNGDFERYFSNHYPLIDSDSDTGGYLAINAAITGQPPTQNGFLFPPPFGEDALSWINKIAAYDHAVFFYGWPEGYTGNYPRPIYGRILNIIAGRSTVEIPDMTYLAGDVNSLLLSAETETRPDRDVNRVLVWAKQPDGAMAAIVPALRMAEGRLAADDINAPEHSWERTLILRDEIGVVPGVAEGIAQAFLTELRNRIMQFPQFVMRGQPRLQWGDKITAKMEADCPNSSDSTINLNDVYRIERVEHYFQLGQGASRDYTTRVWTRPVSNSGF